jgi:hypothetical protein
VVSADVTLEKWSGLNVSSLADFPMNDEEIGHEEEALFDRADRRDPGAGGDGSGGVGPDPPDRDFRVDVLPLEEVVWWAPVGAGPRVEAACR